jgi:hypothetical protein
MKTEVCFTVSNPIPFTDVEDYSPLGIEISVVEGKLIALTTVVEHDVGTGRDEIASKSRAAITSLLILIQYGFGLPVNLGPIQTRVIEPASEVSIGLGFVKVEVALARRVPMPPAETVANLSDATRLQLGWYLLGQNSPTVFERIKNYYKVLEQEKRLTEKNVSPYIPPDEMKYLRDAVSHPELRNPGLLKYLGNQINSTHIDPQNEEHIRFLEQKMPLLQSEAQRILEAKLSKWW